MGPRTTPARYVERWVKASMWSSGPLDKNSLGSQRREGELLRHCTGTCPAQRRATRENFSGVQLVSLFEFFKTRGGLCPLKVGCMKALFGDVETVSRPATADDE